MEECKEIQVSENGLSVAHDMPVLDKLLAAVQAGMDISTLEKFMDLAERNQRREAEQAFHRAFAAFKAEPPQIVKDKLVAYKGTSYTHASIGNVVGAIITAMSNHGLSHSWAMSQDGGNITVTCKITHELGHAESTSLSAGADQSGGKNAIQAIASTVTYLERYTLQAATGIAVLDDDDDGAGAGNVSQPGQTETDHRQTGKQGEKASKPASSRAGVDKWLDYIDSFTDKHFDLFQSACDQHIDNAIAKMSPEHASEMKIAKNEMIKHLQEVGGAK